MTSATSSAIDEIASIAADLGDRSVMEMVDVVRAHKQTSRLQLRVVGAVSSGRATLTNVLLHADVLPVSPIPKAPIGIDVRLGERMSATRVGADGDRMAIPLHQLSSLLMSLDGPRGTRIEIETPGDLLELCDLHLEALEGERSNGEWRDLLAASDYVIFLLNASALLSNAERRFVREHLVPELGLERVAFAINRMDLVAEDERDSILDLVRTFLGPFQTQPAVIDISLREVERTGGGREILSTLIDDLLKQREPLRATALRQTLAAMIDRLSSTVDRLNAIYALETTDVQQAQEQLAQQQEWLERRVERTQRRIAAWVNTLLKETLLRRIEGFGESLRNRLPDEIKAIEDMSAVRRHLPGYIEAVWTDFLRRQMIAIRGELSAEEARIAEMIEADFRELLAGIGRPELEARWDFGSDLQAFHVFVTPRRAKHRAENIARGLGFNGLFMFFVSPPLGVLSLLASQAVQRIYKSDIAQAEATALTTSAVSAVRQVEGEVKKRMATQLEELTRRMQQDVAGLYKRGMDQILELLNERAAHGEDLERRRSEIAAVASHRLPTLRASLELSTEELVS